MERSGGHPPLAEAEAMQIEITGRHVDLPDGIREYVTDKVGRLTRFYDRIQSVHVVFDRDGLNPRAELIVSLDHRRQLVAKESHNDIFAAIDLLTQEMEEQLRRLKQRLRNRKHPPAAPGPQP
jgi:putative sigma-54 modulation protein